MVETFHIRVEYRNRINDLVTVCYKLKNKAIKGAGSASTKDVGIRVHISEWNNCSTIYGPWIVGVDAVAAARNQTIRDGIKKLQECYFKLKNLQGTEPKCSEVVSLFNGEINLDQAVKAPKSLSEAIEDHIEAARLEPSTADVYANGLIPALKTFIRTKLGNETGDVYLRNIDLSFIYRFEMYLVKAKTPRGKPYNPSTISEYVKKLKAVLKTAVRLGNLKENPALNHESMTNKPEKAVQAISHVKEAIFWKMMPEDLHKIETVPVTGSGVKDSNIEEENNKDRYSYDLRRVRLLFLLQTWTGFAYADLEKMKDVNVHITNDLTGKKVILYYRQKNGVLGVVPLFPQTESILQALNFDATTMGSYDTFARKIKALLRYYAINMEGDKSVTHIGRHLFGSRMLHMGFTLEEISRMMGHSSIQETQKVYARIDLTTVNAGYERVKLLENIGTKIAV